MSNHSAHNVHHHVCHHCDYISEMPELHKTQVAYCPNCDSELTRSHPNAHQAVVALGLAAAIMLILAVSFGFISFSSQGIANDIKLLDALEVMFNYRHPLLAFFINFTILIVPSFIILTAITLVTSKPGQLPNRVGIFLLKLIATLKEWSMAEVFLFSILVSLVKILALAHIGMGISFWAYTLFAILFVAMLYYLDMEALWQKYSLNPEKSLVPATGRAIDQNLGTCHHCSELTTTSVCPRCHSEVHIRSPQTVQKTMAFMITALILYIPANLFPVMTTTLLSNSSPTTIIGGIVLLWHEGSYPIAMVIFVASVMLPLTKLVIIALLCFATQLKHRFSRTSFTRIYTIVEFLGKWSMLDVFVVTVLAALVQLGGLMSITPGWGAFFFASMVFMSMLSAQHFDPRLLWDNQYNQDITTNTNTLTTETEHV